MVLRLHFNAVGSCQRRLRLKPESARRLPLGRSFELRAGSSATLKGGLTARELHTDAPASDASYLAYSVKLLTLARYPQSDREIHPEDYVATIEVTAR